MNIKLRIRKRKKRRIVEPLTDELLKELLEAPNPIAFAKQYHLKSRTLPEYLQQLLNEKGLSRPQVIKSADINETHGYQIFTGARGASRNKIIRLAFAMRANLQETNRLLQAAGCNELYCKNRRDAIIIFCLNNSCSLQTTEEELYRFGENTLSDALQ